MYFLLRLIFGKSFLLLQELVRKTKVRLLLKIHSSDFRTNRIYSKALRQKNWRLNFSPSKLVRNSNDRL